ncbi:MAG TPA: ATP-binding cassette domain-containing protein, partial [Chromatiaceae bacterium]|nr:ATP-binding cassette domain-containing protein [Chromatiaceae bacterium]
MLEVINLQCTRGDRCLFSGIGFTVGEGELLHLYGHNGSGKTTLMRTLCGLITPTDGEVRWKGLPIRKQRDEYAAELLYLGHKNGLKDDLTGVENLLI